MTVHNPREPNINRELIDKWEGRWVEKVKSLDGKSTITVNIFYDDNSSAHHANVASAGSGPAYGGNDLSSWTLNKLLALKGMSKGLAIKLAPLTGNIRGAAAERLIKAKNIVLGREEEEELNEAIWNQQIKVTIQSLKNWTRVDFKSLTRAQQTVVASYGHRFGGFRNTEGFRKAVKEAVRIDDWSGVIKELRRDKNSRADKEANYLEEAEIKRIARKRNK